MQFLVLLPIFAFLAFFILDYGSSGKQVPLQAPDARLSFLRASVLWGGLVTLFCEGLSPFHMLSRAGLSVFWGMTAGVAIIWAWRMGALVFIWERLRLRPTRVPATDAILLIGLATIVLLLFLVAWIAPPSNVDSLLYHMARVVHWADNGSLAHYPANFAHQLLKPTWAETAILTLRVLWGNDRPANLVQWFSMAGSLIVVSWIASRLGASRRGQILAALFALSVPMGILQATSTQNDYVVAYWAACLLGLVVLGKQRPLTRFEVLLLGITLGTGMLTKGTFFVYGLPLVAWHFVPMVLQRRPTKRIAEGLVVLAIACFINIGFWSRNFVTYGGPYGTSDWLRRNLTLLRVTSAATTPPVATPAQAVATPVPIEGQLPAAPEEVTATPQGGVDFLGRWARMVALNFVTPSSATNAAIANYLHRFPAVFNEKFFQSLGVAAWNHEDTAGNPLHLVLVLGTLALLFRGTDAANQPNRWLLAGVVLATYAINPLVIGHGAGLWGLRYQLPFFILWAPVFGLAAGTVGQGALGLVGGLGLLGAALPWLLLNNTRPVIGHPPWPTRTESVFRATRTELLFATFAGNAQERSEAFISAAESIRSHGCTDVGLRINSSDYDYLFWWSLGAPESGVHIENIYPLPESQRYSDPAFKPCAILCTICADREQLHGLEMVSEWGGIRLFAGPDYVSDPNGLH